ncbi:MAG: endolytic transglycosylase MltG [Patescibacteria group bacterium]
MPTKAITIGYIIFVILAIILYLNWQAMAPKSKEFNPQLFQIEKGEGVQEIGQKLKKMNLIRNDKIFQILAFLLNIRKKFQPGEYSLSPNMDLLEVIKVLTSQKSALEREITIIEGWSTKEIADYLDERGIIKKEAFLAELQNELAKYKADYEFLRNLPTNASLEGFLFPDTYRVYKETTAEAIIRKMLENFENKITPEMIVEIKKQNRTLFEVITLASLVEKEAADEIERRLIADIFWRRLDNQIPLQSCASINYILGTSKRRLSFKETRTPSSYNTYINKGLPPGPINNPGLSAIKAVIYPLKNDYWFFLATDEGKTIFSRTKEEHNKNKDIYLK